MRHQILDQFSQYAKPMRKIFDQRFENPLHASNARFVWDYWHVPEQYTLLRTPAHAFFPSKLYTNFHRQLVEWGRANLGCHDISPPWLSCYVEGCKQEIHSDVPHGPLAFVYSLTPWTKRKFSGGETFLLRDRTLNFWDEVPAGLERKQLVETIPAKFNRLIVFNPATPHGVTEVRGTHDPREGRLVIHGWFVNPRPFWYGPLTSVQVSKTVERGLSSVELNLGRGLVSIRLSITPAGRVSRIRFLLSTIVGSQDFKPLERALKELQFPKRSKGTELTLPLMCE